MSKFAERLPDDFLWHMDDPKEIVPHFTPGNYTPTKEQTKCLVESAVESVIRWYSLQRDWETKDERVIKLDKEQTAYLMGRLASPREVLDIKNYVINGPDYI